MERRHDIDETVYGFVIHCFDLNYTERFNSYCSISKNYDLRIYISDIKSNGKVSVSITKGNGIRNQENYEFSDRYSKLLRDYFENKIDSMNQNFIRNKNESITNLIKNILDG